MNKGAELETRGSLGRTNAATDLAGRWNAFIVALLDPWTLLLLASTIFFVAFSTVQKNPTVTAIFSAAASICSGLFGGLVTKKWQEKLEMQIMVARGRSAIRNLKLLLSTIISLERRLARYLERITGQNCPVEVVMTYLQEVQENCTLLHDEAINAIENWTDIIPEADVTTQIGKIGTLQSQISQLTIDSERLEEELKSSRDLSAREVRAVRQKLQEKEIELQSARAELSTRRNALDGVLSHSAFSRESSYIGRPIARKCPNCGEPAGVGPPCRRCGTQWHDDDLAPPPVRD